jgi:hypothetical protein
MTIKLTGMFVLVALGYCHMAFAHLEQAEPGVAMDIDGDGQSEWVSVMVDMPGGSGRFYHLVVADTNEKGEPTFRTVFLGDRERILRMWDDQGQVALDMIQAGEGDAACCPSHKVIRRWKMQDGKLMEQPMDAYGRVSVDDFQDATWQLVAMDGEPLPENARVSLVFGEKSRVAGKSGCNRYSTTVEELSSGVLKVGMSLVSTKMACPDDRMSLEQRYL